MRSDTLNGPRALTVDDVGLFFSKFAGKVVSYNPLEMPRINVD